MPRREMAVSESILCVLLAAYVFEDVEWARDAVNWGILRQSIKVEDTCSILFFPWGSHTNTIIVMPSDARLGWPD